MKFLTEHNRSNEEISTKEENYINRALARFIHFWKKEEGLLKSDYQKNAPSVFLIESCKLKGITLRTHGNLGTALMVRCFTEKDRNDDLCLQVETFVNKHK